MGPWRDALREEDKGNYHYKWCKLFVCLVPMSPFLSSNESLRDERVTVSLNEPLLGSGSDLEMSLFRRSLEILRTCTRNGWPD